MYLTLVSVLVGLLFKVCSSSSHGDLDSHTEFDYIIVGGGTAGSVLAARLSEVPSHEVLLLESGPEDTVNNAIEIPMVMYSLLNNSSGVTRLLKPEPQSNACKTLKNNQPFWHQGNVLGGSSSINGLLYLRNSPDDYNDWKSMGLDGWGYNDVLNYFKKSENQTNEAYRQSGYHGTEGPWTITENIVTEKLADTFIKAGREMGYPERDLNGAIAEGFMHSQQNTLKGKRQSTYRAFIDPIKGRRNLYVKTNCLVTKIIINDKIATGVQLYDKMARKTRTLTARNEVIISAGALLSPQLLMLSGIGPRNHLNEMGIPVVQDLPVGNSLYDHVMTDLSFTFNESVSLSYYNYMTDFELLYYLLYGKGAWSSNYHQGSAIFRPGPRAKTALLSCDFDTNMCGFQQSTSDNFDWIRQSGSTSSQNTGPINDHTKGDASGYYIYIEASGQYPNAQATIISGLFQSQSNRQVCVHFYYHMYGMHVKALYVYEVHGNGYANKIWNVTAEALPYQDEIYGIDKWIKAEATASSSTRAVQFTAIRGGDLRGQPYGDIAVDDIMVIDGPCASQGGQSQEGQTTTRPNAEPVTLLNCNFDTGIEYCNWKQLDGTEDNFDWSHKSGKTSSDNTGPSNDHTQGNGNGFYVYIEASGEYPGTSATLETPVVPYHSQGKCLTFYYHMYGRHIGSFRVEMVRNGVAQKIWEIKNTDLTVAGNMVYGYDQWIRAKVELQAYEAKLKFTAVRGGESIGQPYGDIALDDVSIVTGPCENNQGQGQESLPATPILECNFEKGSIENCGFTQNTAVVTDQFDWYMNSGETATSNTGPRTDHTFRNSSGHYIYIEASGIDPGAQAAIRNSEAFDTNEYICVNFHYHMYGKHVGSLSLYEVDTNGNMNQIWRMTREKILEYGLFTGDKAYEWLKESVTASARTRYIKFVASKGGASSGEPYGDVALDDIIVTKKECGYGRMANDPQSVPMNTVFLRCTFDQDECGFLQHQYDDDFDWTRLKGETLSSFTGPDNDHTQGNENGHYMYVESTSQSAFSKAILSTINFSNYKYGEVCLTFYYHMYGQDIGSLSVYERLKSTGKVNLLWIKSAMESSGRYGVNGWLKAEILGTSDTESFIFQATVHGGPEGDIAIDDVMVVNGSCRIIANDIGFLPISQESNGPLLQMEMMSSLFGNDPQNRVFSNNLNYRPEMYDVLHAHEEGRHGMVLMLSLLHPRSKGTLKLRSNNIADDPKIMYNYLTNDEDVKDLIKGIRFVQNLTKTQAFREIGTYYSTPHHPGCKNIFNGNSDEYWECYVRHNTWTNYHYVSTCKMGTGSDAVVDNRLKVIGVRNLRVVDSSVIPKTISGNTMAATVMIAEKAADMIKAESPTVSVSGSKRKLKVEKSLDRTKTNLNKNNEDDNESSGGADETSVKELELDEDFYSSILKKLQSNKH